MEVVKCALFAALAASTVRAADFSLTIGNPVAANGPSKSAGLAVRLENCPTLPKATLTGTAEGLVEGMRRSAPLQITAVSPGIYTVAQNWPKGGTWVMNLESTCGVAKAGAVVPFHGATFLRESTKLYPRFATASEVDSSLKELERGTK